MRVIVVLISTCIILDAISSAACAINTRHMTVRSGGRRPPNGAYHMTMSYQVYSTKKKKKEKRKKLRLGLKKNQKN